MPDLRLLPAGLGKCSTTPDFFADTPSSPVGAPYPIVPSDSDPLLVVPKGIYVGRGGTVTLRGVGAVADVSYVNLPDASYIAVRASHVRATGTTAANLIAEA